MTRSRAPSGLVAAYVIDSRPSAGLGHVTRSLALADAVGASAAETTILLHGGPVDLPGIALRPDWTVDRPDDPNGRLATWCRAAAASAKIIVVDDPTVRLSDELARRPNTATAAFVDGQVAEGPYDVFINGTAYAGAIDRDRLRTASIACFGLEYACLRHELRAHRRTARAIPEVARRILVTLGGTDPRALTPAVTEVVGRTLARAAGTATIDVVIGPGSAVAAATAEAAERNADLGVETVLHQRIGDLGTLMAGADLAVSAGGGTLYELAFLGVPTLAIPQTPDEQQNAAAVARLGACVTIRPDDGWEAQLEVALDALADDGEGRRKMSRAAMRLVDGNGPDRLARILVSRARSGPE